MPERSLLDYGRDDAGNPVVPRFSLGAFAKDIATLTRAETGEQWVVQTNFEHWSMYDYFRALFVLAGGDWNDTAGACHLLGVRELDSDYRRRKRIQGEWNDLVVVVREGDPPQLYTYEASIDPGGTLGKHPHPEGQLLLDSGVHRARLGTGTHGKQEGPVMILTDLTFYRDANRDGTPDTPNDLRVRRAGEGQGVHIHWSSRKAAVVGDWSTGCTVLHYGLKDAEYQEFIGLMKGHQKSFGNVQGITELSPDSPDPQTALTAKLDLKKYDIEYVVTTTVSFRTPAEVLAQPRFYFLLQNVKRPPPAHPSPPPPAPPLDVIEGDSCECST